MNRVQISQENVITATLVYILGGEGSETLAQQIGSDIRQCMTTGYSSQQAMTAMQEAMYFGESVMFHKAVIGGFWTLNPDMIEFLKNYTSELKVNNDTTLGQKQRAQEVLSFMIAIQLGETI